MNPKTEPSEADAAMIEELLAEALANIARDDEIINEMITNIDRREAELLAWLDAQAV